MQSRLDPIAAELLPTAPALVQDLIEEGYQEILSQDLEKTALAVGDIAPDFVLHNVAGEPSFSEHTAAQKVEVGLSLEILATAAMPLRPSSALRRRYRHLTAKRSRPPINRSSSSMAPKAEIRCHCRRLLFATMMARSPGPSATATFASAVNRRTSWRLSKARWHREWRGKPEQRVRYGSRRHRSIFTRIT